jgi:hypothetical protein
MCATSPLNPMAMNHFGTLPEFTDSCHVSLRSHGLDLTSSLRSHSDDFNSQTEKPTSTSPELEICCQVSPHRSTTLVSLGIQASDVSTLQPPPSSRSSNLSTHILLDQRSRFSLAL